MTAPVNYAPGQLPPFWDRSVVFFANLLGLFFGNVGAMKELAAKVGGIESYGGRLCPLIDLLFRGRDNLLVLESPPDESLLRYFTGELGLSIPDHLILDHADYKTLCEVLETTGGEADLQTAAARIAAHPAAWIDGFVTDEVLTSVARCLGKQTLVTADISRRSNNKLLLHRFLQQQGFPVFDTHTAESRGDIASAAASLRKKGYRHIVVKAQVGASGIGMQRLEAADPAVGQIESYMFHEGLCLVQGWVDGKLPGIEPFGSPSVQMFLDETTVWLYDVTEQILSAESVHEGNIAPPLWWNEEPQIAAQLHRQAEATGRWLHDTGYRGTASADFLVVRCRGRFDVRLCEVNARVTGATYPAVLARRFCPGGSWLMRNLVFDPPLPGSELLAALHRAGHLCLAGADHGVLPINFNANQTGQIRKGQFLCLGRDQNTCLDYLMHSAGVLPVTWTYDRD